MSSILQRRAIKAQMEVFADPNNYYVANDCGDGMYRGNAIKEAQAALKGNCFMCDESLADGDPDNDTERFHMACAERSQALLEAQWEEAQRQDAPF